MPDVRLRWIVTGAGGMLGRDLVAQLRAGGENVTALGRSELDITDPIAVEQSVCSAAGDMQLVIVNLAAWTDVDAAERAEDSAHAINAGGARNLAQAAGKTDARMIQISTDYVFDGTGSAPYPEDARCSPVNAYGRTKADGENAVLETLPDSGVVLRTAWLYGEHGQNFVHTMIKLAAERDTLDVVDDQIGQPTWTGDLALRIIEVAGVPNATGVFHATNGGQASWFELARAVFEERGLDPGRVRPTTTDRFPRPAQRPAYSVLGQERWAVAGLPAMRDWRSALSDFMLVGSG